MLKLFRPLDGQDFAWSAAIRNGAFAAFTIAFPFLLQSFVSASGCRGIGGACGALALFVSIYVKPLVFSAFVLSYALITIRRLGDVGLAWWLAAGVLVIMWADIHWATVAGAPWSVAFVTGSTGGAPISLMAGLALVTTLCVMTSMPVSAEDDMPSPGRQFGPGAWVFISLLLVSAVGFVVGYFALRRGGAWMVISMQRGWLAPLMVPAKIAVAMAPMVLAVFWYREWTRDGRYGAHSPVLYAIGGCTAVAVAGSAVTTLVVVWSSAAWLLAMRGAAMFGPAFKFAALAELLALLVLPWLLWLLPRTPSVGAPAVPMRPSPVRQRPGVAAGRRASGPRGAVAFGRRGLS